MRFLVVPILLFMAMPALAQDAPPAFSRCVACHAIGEDAGHKVGPVLNGVVGRLVGSQPDYNYSQAMLAARDEGMEWSRETVGRYLKRPAHFLPGTTMNFYGMGDRTEIDAVIDYLASFDAEGGRVVP